MRVKANRLNFISEPASPGAYASGDAIGVIQSLAGVFKGSDQSGVVEGLTVIDTDNQSAPLNIFLYQSQVAGGTDNAAYAPGAAEILECVGIIQVAGADYVSVGVRSVASIKPDFALQLEQSTTIYAQVVSAGTPTYTAANSLRLNFVIAAD